MLITLNTPKSEIFRKKKKKTLKNFKHIIHNYTVIIMQQNHPHGTRVMFNFSGTVSLNRDLNAFILD